MSSRQISPRSPAWVPEDPIAEAVQEYDACRRRGLSPSIFHRQKLTGLIHHVEIAPGGRLARYRPPRHVGSCQARGDRQAISEFSSKSRHALLSVFNSMDRTQIDPERVWFVTLTYPRIYPKLWKIWKAHLDALAKRVFRAWGRLPFVWKLEPQERGAPHFHLLLVVSPGMVQQLRAFQLWISTAWYETVNSGLPEHERAGTEVEPVYSWNQATSYAAKYLTKTCFFADPDTGEQLKTGRFWGVRNRDLLPISRQVVTCPQRVWHRVRRPLRKYLERVAGYKLRPKKGPRSFAWYGIARGCSCFVPSSIVSRLLDYEMRDNGTDPFHFLIEVQQTIDRVKAIDREAWLYT